MLESLWIESCSIELYYGRMEDKCINNLVYMPLHSENETRADNQQERIAKFIGWIAGFVDGEGCFSVGFVRQQDRKEKTRIRRGYRTGYQVFHEFAVTQGVSSLSALQEIQNFFGVGKIYINTRYDNHNEHLYRYVVRKRDDLVNVIIPFFTQNKLKTKKKNDFEKFVQCVKYVLQNKHLTMEGMVEIAMVAQQMNRKKSGKNLAIILRDHTPSQALV